MPPPPPSNLGSRLFLGPALRAQPDRRLVKLVRDGYENAFDEIMRRYGKPLGRYAAAIVPSHRAEDVTQDAFSKALLALRDTDKEIELRPWLYRIVRNTALNDVRDQPPPAAPLHEGIDGVETPPQALERREEIAALMRRLAALPEPQRAAIVMRELEGLSHEEIAAALGLSGGGARQAIYNARRSMRNGLGMLVPAPLLQYLLGAAGATAGAGLAAAGGGAAASAGGAGAGLALKAGLATLFVAGAAATGVALHDSSRHPSGTKEADAARAAEGPATDARQAGASDAAGPAPSSGEGSGRGRHGAEPEPGDDHGAGGGSGSGRSGSSGDDGGGEHHASGDDGSGSGSSKSGPSGSGDDISGGFESGDGGSGSGETSDRSSGSGSDSSGSGDGGSGGDLTSGG